jgi:hypothetical protein
MKSVQEVLMEIIGMLTGACEPAAECGLRSGKDASGGARTKTFGDGV